MQAQVLRRSTASLGLPTFCPLSSKLAGGRTYEFPPQLPASYATGPWRCGLTKSHMSRKCARGQFLNGPGPWSKPTYRSPTYGQKAETRAMAQYVASEPMA